MARFLEENCICAGDLDFPNLFAGESNLAVTESGIHHTPHSQKEMLGAPTSQDAEVNPSLMPLVVFAPVTQLLTPDSRHVSWSRVLSRNVSQPSLGHSCPAHIEAWDFEPES